MCYVCYLTKDHLQLRARNLGLVFRKVAGVKVYLTQDQNFKTHTVNT
jgi:hypothetical protein